MIAEIINWRSGLMCAVMTALILTAAALNARDVRYAQADSQETPAGETPAMEEAGTPAGTQVPLYSAARGVVQPLIGIAFVTPWIVHLSLDRNKNKDFFKRADELSLYLATPLAMSLSISMAGWLIDHRSYNYFAGFGLSAGLSNFGAGVGYLFTALFVMVPAGGHLSMRTYYIIGTVLSGWFSVIGSMGGDFLGKLITRKRYLPLQASLVAGEGERLSLGVPLPAICPGYDRDDIRVSVALMRYSF